MSALVEEPRVELPPSPVGVRPAVKPRFRITRRGVGLVFVGIALWALAFLVFLFVLSPIVAASQQPALVSEFQTLAVQGPASLLDWQPATGDPVAILTIPRLAMNEVVVQGTTPTQTIAGPGHFAASAQPGRPGNSVIIGRRTTFGGPFRNLGELHRGDEITVTTGVGEFSYLVTKVFTVATGAQDVIDPTTQNLLTLVTSDPAYRVSGRLVVQAKLVGDPAAAPTQTQPLITTAETGMAGDPAAVPPFLLWAELLVLSVVAMLWMRRRLSARVAWLLGVPLILALSWASFLSLARILPASL